MRFLIISDAHHIIKDDQLVAYAPYVKEMDLWLKHVNQVHVVAPTVCNQPLLSQAFKRQDIQVTGLRRLEFHTLWHGLISLLQLPYQFVVICWAMVQADHIHLRCPGNLALLACMAQILFPSKTKTVKYAGNWNPNAQQPIAYNWQKKILSNTSLSKNIQVLVYGQWPNQSQNIKSFFTASYFEHQKQLVSNRDYTGTLHAVYAGSLSANKRPVELIAIVTQLRQKGVLIQLDMYGDGVLKKDLEEMILQQDADDYIKLHGNQPLEVVTKAYKKAHLAFLLSKSEGWPKAVAEPMFWGCVPIATAVSCVPWMLGKDSNDPRGCVVEDLDQAVSQLELPLKNASLLERMSQQAMIWSRQFTLDRFEDEISLLLHKKQV